MSAVIEIPRFAHDAQRMNLEREIAEKIVAYAEIATPEQVTFFWHGAARFLRKSGALLPGNINPKGLTR